MVQFGWTAGTEQYGPNELLEYAIAAEDAGFDAIAASDHFHPWAEKGQSCFVWSLLGAIAARTRKIIIGTAVTCPTLRYHPSVIAQAAATLAVMAPNRVFLGVGTGEALNEYSSCGAWPPYRVRQEQLAEAIDLMRQLWSGEKVTFKGVHYRTHKAKLYTRPQAPIPVYVSSLVPNSAAFAGRHGDGLYTIGLEGDELKQQLEAFAAGAREAGKDPARLPRMTTIAVAFTDDRQKAIELRKAYWAGTAIPAMFTERLYTPEKSEQNGSVVGNEMFEKGTCISADPDEHVRHARRYIEMGYEHIYFTTAGPDERKMIEAYGRDVLPRLRAS
jgi:coenzyme F420-dependent glucose-6-phosphate dehydrogenase